jgi:glycerol-3-phosphate acyltransferase PlsX
MGGDHAPKATVAGAVRASREQGIAVTLVGDQARIQAELDKHGPAPHTVEVLHAPTTIGMDESPGTALLRKRDSSIVVATDLVKDGRACAVVSAGNSGAAMGAASLRLGMLPGVERPAIAMLLPSRRGSAVVLDVGATVDTRPEHLRDFARMGAVYAQVLLHVDRPRVGLLSIGTELSKGNTITKKAHPLLAQLPIQFVGNVEGQHIAQGDVEVVVCDGFVGNAILKSTEGYAELFWRMFQEGLGSSLRARVGAWLLRPAMNGFARKLDYASYGGALLVGVNGICVIGHGRSSPTAVVNAIRVASELAEQNVLDRLTSSFGQPAPPEGQAAVGRQADR